MSKLNSILVIDDNEIDFHLVKRHLIRSDFCEEVFHEEDGQHALDFLNDWDHNRKIIKNHFPPALIILDIHMPTMNGHEFLDKYKLLREDEKYKETRVILYSTTRDRDVEESIEKYSFVLGHVSKHSSKDDLDGIRKLLES